MRGVASFPSHTRENGAAHTSRPEFYRDPDPHRGREHARGPAGAPTRIALGAPDAACASCEITVHATRSGRLVALPDRLHRRPRQPRATGRAHAHPRLHHRVGGRHHEPAPRRSPGFRQPGPTRASRHPGHPSPHAHALPGAGWRGGALQAATDPSLPPSSAILPLHGAVPSISWSAGCSAGLPADITGTSAAASRGGAPHLRRTPSADVGSRATSSCDTSYSSSPSQPPFVSPRPKA